MAAILSFLTSRWFLTGIGAALLAALVWFIGPLLAFLEDWPIRLAIILAIALRACRAVSLSLVGERFIDIVDGIRVQAHVGAVVQPYICANHRIILQRWRWHAVVLDWA